MAFGSQADGQVVFEIVGDNSKVKTSLTDTTTAIKDESKKWDDAIDSSSENMTTAFDKALDIKRIKDWGIELAKELAKFGIECIETASDLEEVQNVVDVTFGAEGSKKIEKWSKDASAKFGLTELQAKRYSSTLGAMMKSSGMTEDQIAEMSMSLSGLSADMASFYNMDFDTAFSKIQSGMAGMSMPLRQLGIDMSETAVSAYALEAGFDKEYSKMSEAEQMIVRYKYLMKATADAQGDFARTSNSYANSQRRVTTAFETLKAQIGDALLPIATQVSDAVAGLLEVLTYSPPETAFDVAEESMKDAVAEATQAQGILGYMEKLQEKYGDNATKTEEWATALEQLKKVMPDVNQYIDEETQSLTLSNEQLKEYVQNKKDALIEEAKAKAVRQLNEEYTQAGLDYYTAEINRDLAREQANESALGIIDYIIAGKRKQMDQYGLTEEDFGEGTFDREAYLSAINDGLTSINTLMNEAYKIADENGDGYGILEEYERIYNEQSSVADTASESMKNLNSKMVSLEADISIANQALQRLSASANNASSALVTNTGNGGADGSFASGLDYVPFDGFKAILHKGERVETASEASMRRMYGLQSPTFNMGSIIDKLGGDVYLDGRIVGQVMSAQQARQYKNLNRSGWKA